MIDYEQSIDPVDIERYWGGGVVLLRHKGVWSAYNVSNTHRNRVHLARARNPELYHEDAPAKVDLPRTKFFKEAVLHRPQLGVLVKDGIVWMLGWKPARGDLNKAIQDGDVLKQKLYDAELPPVKAPVAKAQKLKGLKQHTKWLAEHMQAYQDEFVSFLDDNTLDAYNEMHEEWENINQIFHLENDVRFPKPLEGGGGKNTQLVVAFMNQTPVSIAEAARLAKEQGAAFVRDTLWVMCQPKGKPTLYNGTVEVGTIDTDGKLVAKKFKNEIQMRVSERVARAISALEEKYHAV